MTGHETFEDLKRLPLGQSPCLPHNTGMHIFDERAEHEGSVRRVITNAFGRDAEARLVEELRFAGDLAISLVAEDAGEICGHVALSRLKTPQRALALAPVSTVPVTMPGIRVAYCQCGHYGPLRHDEPPTLHRFGLPPQLLIAGPRRAVC